MTAPEPIRVLIAKPGLDGHDRGAKVIARVLKEAGMEVFYTGIRQTPQTIVEAAYRENVDVIGISILSGAHVELFPQVTEVQIERGMEEVIIIAGGIIPKEDHDALRSLGVAAIFGPGSSSGEIAEFIREAVARRRQEGILSGKDEPSESG